MIVGQMPWNQFIAGATGAVTDIHQRLLKELWRRKILDTSVRGRKPPESGLTSHARILDNIESCHRTADAY